MLLSKQERYCNDRYILYVLSGNRKDLISSHVQCFLLRKYCLYTTLQYVIAFYQCKYWTVDFLWYNIISLLYIIT